MTMQIVLLVQAAYKKAISEKVEKMRTSTGSGARRRPRSR